MSSEIVAVAVPPQEMLDDASICPACAERGPSDARFCWSCGAPMVVDTGEVRTVTVLFADLSGFTSFSESADPEAVRAVAETAARRFGDIVRREGGVVDKIIGDCVMATFGTPVPRADDPARAVRAALAMQREVAQDPAAFRELAVSIGVMTGSAIYAPAGPAGEYTVLGETVNDAARLQSAANRGEVLIGRATRDAVAGSIEAEPVAPIERTGGPLEAWRAIDESVSIGRVEDTRVSSQEDLARLREYWERVQVDRAPTLVSIVGPLRAGKRSLVRSFISGLEAHVMAPDGTAAGLARCTKDLFLRTTPGSDTPNDGTAPNSEAAVVTMLLAVSRTVPVVVVLEEAHEAEQGVLEIVSAMARTKEQATILVVLTADTSLFERAPDLAPVDGRRRVIRLKAIDRPLEEMDIAPLPELRLIASPSMVTSTGVTVCPVCTQDNIDRARFCVWCGARTSSVTGERRTVSVLFADVRGFTRFAECEPGPVVRATADAVTDRLRQIVTSFGGTVDKVISENGLKVMAIFGAPIAHEDDPTRAVRAALAMRTAAATERSRFSGLELGIGITTGEAIYAPVGPSGGYTVLGDTVNTAARLQAGAARGEILIGAATANALDASITLEAVAPIHAKGKSNAIQAWRASGQIESPRTVARRQAMVGRVDELARLHEAWDGACRSRRATTVTITASAGMGKSMLVAAFIKSLGDDARLHAGHCLPYGEGITYWPLVEIIKDAAGILHDDDADAVSGKLGSLLEETGIDDLDQLRTIAVAIANLVAAPTTPRGTYQAVEISRAELHWGVRRLLELLAVQRPMVLVFEDLHWAEPTLLEFIEELGAAGEAPILVLATGREEIGAVQSAHSITLAPLSEAEGASLVGNRFSCPPPVLDRLIAASGGNPLYLEELVQMLIDRGAIDPSGVLIGDLDLVDVPDSLQGLIEARLDQLGDEERAIAGSASVVGRVFWDGAVTFMAGRESRAMLRELVERDVVFPVDLSSIAGHDEYVFKHILLRDVTYGRVPKVERATMHQRCGSWIAALSSSPDEFVEFVAYHLEQACRLTLDLGDRRAATPTLAAVDALRRAARKAENHEGTREADRYYARALEILGDGYPETETALLLDRAETRALLGDLQGSIELLRSVREHAGRLERVDLRCRATLQLAYLVTTGSTAEARSLLDEGRALARVLDDKRLQIIQALASGFVRAVYEGASDEGIAELEQALDLASEHDDQMLLLSAHQRLGNLLMNAGRLAEAEEHFTRAAALARTAGSIREETEATRFLATIKYYRGPRDEAERLAVQALEWLDRNPNRIVEVQTLSRAAWLAVARGDLDEAARRLETARQIADGIGGWMKVEALKNRCVVFALRRELHQVARAAAEARAAVLPGDEYADGAACLAEAMAATVTPDEASARNRFERALELLRSEPLDLGLAHVWFGRALRSFGDEAGSRAQFEAARAIFASMDAGAMLEDIARLSA